MSEDLEGYTAQFKDHLNRVPRVDANGRDISPSTRRNIALQEWQHKTFGDVYPSPSWPLTQYYANQFGEGIL